MPHQGDDNCSGTSAAPALDIGGWPAVDDHVSGGRRRHLARQYHPGRRRMLSGGHHVLSESRRTFADRARSRRRPGNTFVGEYGAILDGTGWSTSDDTQGAFRAHNQDIDYVTIRNLVIRNMPQSGIHTYYWMSDHWTIEYNEIASNKMRHRICAQFHHPEQLHPPQRGQYLVVESRRAGWRLPGVRADNTTFDSNEIAYNGPEQKVGLSANVTFRNNFVHHNIGDGIWYDTNTNAGALIEGNRVEDNGRNGIFFEASIGATIRNNTVRRNRGRRGVYLHVPERPDLQQLARSQFRGHRIFPQLRLAVRGGRCQEQCGVRQHGRRRHAELRVRERLQLPSPRAPQHSSRRI